MRRVRLAATLRSAVLLLLPLRGTATDARVLLEPEFEFGSCIARLFGVMRVRSPDDVMRLPPSLDGRDAVAWLVVPWLVVGCSRRGAATREEPLLSCADGYSRMTRDEPGVMRVDSRIAGDESRLADEESRTIGDDCRTVGDDSRITGEDDSRRGDADRRELLSPRDTLDGADRWTPEELGARDGPMSLGVALGAEGADGGGPLEARGADGAEAEPPPPPEACPGDIRARC